MIATFEARKKVASAPAWVAATREVDGRCCAIDCELKRVAALQRRRLLVTFDAQSDEACERELRDATGVVHDHLRQAEAVLSAPKGAFYDAPRDSEAAHRARSAAKQYWRRQRDKAVKSVARHVGERESLALFCRVFARRAAAGRSRRGSASSRAATARHRPRRPRCSFCRERKSSTSERSLRECAGPARARSATERARVRRRLVRHATQI